MAVFDEKSKYIDEFLNKSNQVIQILAPYASKEEVLELNQFFNNFKMKVKDFYQENRKLNIGVVGQVKAGKSSFLNTLLFDGKEILPKASTPKTATLTKMEYSDENKIYIEYYSIEEWEILEKNASVMHEDDMYTSAREIMNMVSQNGIDVKPYLEKGKEELSFGSYDELVSQLNQYVGEDGKFTPIVKAVTLSLNKEEFKGLSIVDTPGLNDPIASRTIRTKEFIEVCDVVFFLSQSGSFLDKSDWTLLSNQLPQKGVKRLVLIASKYDSGIRDVLKEKDEDDIFGDDDNSSDTIEGACSIIRRKLRKRAKLKIGEYIKNLEERGKSKELIEVIKQCETPILISSIAHNMLKKTIDDYSPEEKNIYYALSNFSSDMENDLKLLGNFNEVITLFDGVIKEKEVILEEKEKTMVPTAKNELRYLLQLYKEKSENRLFMLENSDKKQLEQQKVSIEAQINKVRYDIISIFNDVCTKLESTKLEGIREIRVASQEYRNIKESVETKTHKHRRKVSDAKWYNPFTWWDSHIEIDYSYETIRSYQASDAVDNLHRFSIEAVEQVESIFTKTVTIQEVKRKLLNVVVSNFDMSSTEYDATLFRIMVEDTIRQIQFPIFNIDMSKEINQVATRFSGQITRDSERGRLIETLNASISSMYDKLAQKLEEEVTLFKHQMDSISEQIEDKLLKNMKDEFDLIIAKFDNKDTEIQSYNQYIHLLSEEIKKI